MAHTGTPRTKFLVPSIGSITHRRAPWPVRPHLLAEHGVAWPGPAELGADDLLGAAVGIGDRCGVRLGLHPQVLGLEPGHGQTVDLVGDHVREPEVVVVTGRPVG